MTTDPFWSDRFHRCALAAGFLAVSEGRLADREYVKRLTYTLYESGAFGDGCQSGSTGTLAPSDP